MIGRREFLAIVGAGAGAAPSREWIAGIERSVLWRGRETGKTWFHPRACRIPGDPPTLLMTLQEITGSDVYHHVNWSESLDLGRT